MSNQSQHDHDASVPRPVLPVGRRRRWYVLLLLLGLAVAAVFCFVSVSVLRKQFRYAGNPEGQVVAEAYEQYTADLQVGVGRGVSFERLAVAIARAKSSGVSFSAQRIRTMLGVPDLQNQGGSLREWAYLYGTPQSPDSALIIVIDAKGNLGSVSFGTSESAHDMATTYPNGPSSEPNFTEKEK